MKKTLIWFIKLFISGITALAIVSGLCFFYYNLPVHHTNKTGATDYLWDKNHISIRGTEGFAFTKTDEFGFVNTYPDKKDEVDILLMGSSHTEGFNVNSDKNYAYLLNKELKENGYDKYAYNIGTSAHEFIRCLKNLENAVETYTPSDCVVIETSNIVFDKKALEQLNNGTYPTLASYSSGLIYQLQKMDFFRLAYSQISSFVKKDTTPPSKNNDTENIDEYQKLIETAIENAGKVGKDNNCRVIIMYCPDINIDYYGKVIEQPYSAEQEIFKAACEKYDVEFIDMFTEFEESYNQTRVMPHGFSNTTVGEGHINESGHRCIAKKLYSTIIEG